MKNIIIGMFCFLCFFSCKNDNSKVAKLESNIENRGPSKVTIIETNGKYQLMVDNKPFYINGAGLEFGNISALAKHHGNSFRTWRTENGQKSGKAVLDEAHKYGLKVAMGIEVGRERHGFDYNNVPDPTNPENLTKLNGRGIFLMKNLVDDIKFHDNGKKATIALAQYLHIFIQYVARSCGCAFVWRLSRIWG